METMKPMQICWGKKGKKQLPGTSSITIYIGCRWVQTPISFTILGWSYCLSILQNTQQVYYINKLYCVGWLNITEKYLKPLMLL